MQKCGMVATCIAYRKADDIDVQFEDGTIRKNVVYSFIHACAVRITHINRISFIDEHVPFRAHLAHMPRRNTEHVSAVRDASVTCQKVVHHMHIAVAAAGLALVRSLPPVEHVSHVQLAFAHGFVIGTSYEV